MIQAWKIPHIIKGALTSVPVLNSWRLRHASTGGTNSAHYCYRVWLRHLTVLSDYGFKIKEQPVAELGPGDSIGAGLAALLSGADRYIGLDAFPFSRNTDLEGILHELIQRFSSKEPMSEGEDFPDQAIDWEDFPRKAAQIICELRNPINVGRYVNYQAPWSSPNFIAHASLGLVFSHCVLEYVDPLGEIYRDMYSWLKAGGYCSHHLAFSATHLSPYWNGHWAYTDWQWKLTRGNREFLLNREPLSTHLEYAKEAGFEILCVKPEYEYGGLKVDELSPRFRMLQAEDLRTIRATLILRKPS